MSQVDFFVHAYYAKSIVVIDVPFEASNDRTDLVPGLSVQIDRREYDDDHYYYRVKREHSGNRLVTGILTQDYPVSDFVLLDHVDIVCNMDYVDQQGNVVTFSDPRDVAESNSSTSTGPGYRGPGIIGTDRILHKTHDIEFVRFTIALEPYHVIVPLTLTDIPISSK